MRVSREGNLVTVINVFETTPEQQQALIDQWTRFTEEIKDEPGVIGLTLTGEWCDDRRDDAPGRAHRGSQRDGRDANVCH